jgi:hypothetical protein
MLNKIAKPKRVFTLIVLLISSVNRSWGQTPSENPVKLVATPTPTIQSLAVESINRKLSLLSAETFSKYLQLAYSRDLLKQQDADNGSTYTLKGSLFAVGGIFNGKFNNLSTLQGNYFNRNFTVEIGAKAQGTTKLSDGVLGFTYAIINKRDPLFNFTRNDSLMQGRAVRSLSTAYTIFKTQISTNPNRTKLEADYNNAVRLDGISGVANQIKFFKEQGIDGVEEYSIEMVTDSLKQGALLTVFGHGNTDFANNKPITQSDLGVQFLIGLSNNKGRARPWDLNIKAFYAWRPDTIAGIEKRNLNRTSFTASLGVNKVLVSGTNTKKSFLEFSLDAGYERRTGILYSEEDRDRPYGQAVVRARITDQVWVPLTVQLDLKNGNALGFLNIVWNLTP